MRRMYTENQLVKVVEDNAVKGIKNKDIQVAGITSAGIANTGGLGNIGNVVVSGDITAQGEGKGVIKANVIEQVAPTWQMDLSINEEYLTTLGFSLISKYYKLVQFGNILYLVCSLCVQNDTEGAVTVNWDNLASQNGVSIPQDIGDRIYDKNGKKLTENSTADIIRYLGANGTSNSPAYMSHSNVNTINVKSSGTNSISAGSRGTYDCRTFIVLV